MEEKGEEGEEEDGHIAVEESRAAAQQQTGGAEKSGGLRRREEGDDGGGSRAKAEGEAERLGGKAQARDRSISGKVRGELSSLARIPAECKEEMQCISKLMRLQKSPVRKASTKEDRSLLCCAVHPSLTFLRPLMWK